MQPFLDTLKRTPSPGVFNPWYEQDLENELGPEGPAVRRQQLCAYLEERRSARWLLMAEAPGYQGGHFTGIAMTSERILLGHLRGKGIAPEAVFRSTPPRRTSRPELRPLGFTEPTATIVWGVILSAGLDPRDFVLWNAFPWHPWHPQRGRLTNRTPSETELAEGKPPLHALLEGFNFRQIIAIGAKSKKLLHVAGVEAPAVRHPANGGAPRFRQEFLALTRKAH